jgi:hypothetical protein
MIHVAIIRVHSTDKLGSQLEVALGHSGEYPRVMFRSSVFIPALKDDGATVRDFLEELGEELFNVGAYAESLASQRDPGASGEEPESSVQLLLDATLDGGGWGGAAGDGQRGEASP